MRMGYYETHEIISILRAIKEITLSTQADVAALNAAIAQLSTDLAAASVALQTELDSLVASNPGIDVTGFTTQIQAIDASAQALAALKPTPAA